MMNFILKYWSQITFLITVIIMPFTGYLIGKYRKLKNEHVQIDENIDLLKQANLCTLRNSIVKTCEDYLNKGFAPIYIKDSMAKTYEIYKKLGGDTYATSLNERLQALPIEKIKKKKEGQVC